MEFLPISFIAGILTVLAPCVLPLLPVIIGGSLDSKNHKRPVIITLSLALSVVIFTLLLKVSTEFIDIPQSFWKWFSASIILIFALTLLFPDTWAKISNKYLKTGIEHKSQSLMYKMFKKEGTGSAIILGAAMGPVFASCSPTYFIIIGTVLPASYFIGVLNLLAYGLGLALVMLLIAFAGKKVMKVLNIASNPKGWFKRGLGILFLIVSIAVVTGLDKQFEAWVLDQEIFDVTKVEERILERFGKK